jgi:hypothetical protein
MKRVYTTRTIFTAETQRRGEMEKAKSKPEGAEVAEAAEG